MQLNETDSKSKSELFNARSTMYVPRSKYRIKSYCHLVDRCAADLKDKMMDGYLDFCQRALLPEADGDGGKYLVMIRRLT